MASFIKDRSSKERFIHNAWTAQRVARPLSAFYIFSNLHRQQLQQRMPHLNSKELSKYLGDLWSQMTAEHKEPYYEEARRGGQGDFCNCQSCHDADGMQERTTKSGTEDPDQGVRFGGYVPPFHAFSTKMKRIEKMKKRQKLQQTQGQAGGNLPGFQTFTTLGETYKCTVKQAGGNLPGFQTFTMSYDQVIPKATYMSVPSKIRPTASGDNSACLRQAGKADSTAFDNAASLSGDNTIPHQSVQYQNGASLSRDSTIPHQSVQYQNGASLSGDSTIPHQSVQYQNGASLSGDTTIPHKSVQYQNGASISGDNTIPHQSVQYQHGDNAVPHQSIQYQPKTITGENAIQNSLPGDNAIQHQSEQYQHQLNTFIPETSSDNKCTLPCNQPDSFTPVSVMQPEADNTRQPHPRRGQKQIWMDTYNSRQADEGGEPEEEETSYVLVPCDINIAEMLGWPVHMLQKVSKPMLERFKAEIKDSSGKEPVPLGSVPKAETQTAPLSHNQTFDSNVTQPLPCSKPLAEQLPTESMAYGANKTTAPMYHIKNTGNNATEKLHGAMPYVVNNNTAPMYHIKNTVNDATEKLPSETLAYRTELHEAVANIQDQSTSDTRHMPGDDLYTDQLHRSQVNAFKMERDTILPEQVYSRREAVADLNTGSMDQTEKRFPLLHSLCFD